MDVRARPAWLKEAATGDDPAPQPADRSAEEKVDEFEVDVAFSLPIAHDPTNWEVRTVFHSASGR